MAGTDVWVVAIPALAGVVSGFLALVYSGRGERARQRQEATNTQMLQWEKLVGAAHVEADRARQALAEARAESQALQARVAELELELRAKARPARRRTTGGD